MEHLKKQRKKMKTTIFKIGLFCMLIVFSACNVDCNSDCMSAPEPITFELVDATTQENVFTSTLYNSDDITIVDTENNEVLTHVFISENNKNLLQIGSVGWKTEQLTLAIKIANETLFTLFIDAERLQGDCCTFTKYKEITLHNVSFQFDTSTGIYKVTLN